MSKFRKKPVVIDAVQWTGDNVSEVSSFLGQASDFGLNHKTNCWRIITIEGIMDASPGDWIIRGVENEVYPCKPSIFAATYEGVSS